MASKKNDITDKALERLIFKMKELVSTEVKSYSDKYHKKYTLTIPSSGWATFDKEFSNTPETNVWDGFYYYYVKVDGVSSTDIPEVFCNTGGVSSSSISDYLKAYNSIIYSEAVDGGLKFKAYSGDDAPAVDLTIDILGLSVK